MSLYHMTKQNLGGWNGKKGNCLTMGSLLINDQIYHFLIPWISLCWESENLVVIGSIGGIMVNKDLGNPPPPKWVEEIEQMQ